MFHKMFFACCVSSSDLLTLSHPPKRRFAPVRPVVLLGAVRAAVHLCLVPPETDPEVPVGGSELRDELLHQLLLRRRLHAQQLPAVPPARQVGLLEVQLPPELGEVGQLVAGLPSPRPAHPLTCTHRERRPRARHLVIRTTSSHMLY